MAVRNERIKRGVKWKRAERDGRREGGSLCPLTHTSRGVAIVAGSNRAMSQESVCVGTVE